MPLGYCRYTGVAIHSASDGVWDDGDWISWDYIWQLGQESESEQPTKSVDPELTGIFESLVHTAAAYKERTGRYLDIFGELGELYAEVQFGIERHKANATGSDGRLGDDFVEVKTISPLKKDDKVRVKRAGHFNKLLIVKITENFFFDAVMINRKDLAKGDGKFASARFSDAEQDEPEGSG